MRSAGSRGTGGGLPAREGVGIPIEKQEHIFEPFYRAHAGTPFDVGGVGLGLFIARTIVEQHRGSLSFESHEGQGSVFRVRLPHGRVKPPNVTRRRSAAAGAVVAAAPP